MIEKVSVDKIYNSSLVDSQKKPNRSIGIYQKNSANYLPLFGIIFCVDYFIIHIEQKITGKYNNKKLNTQIQSNNNN
jgi:hypothetical protein